MKFPREVVELTQPFPDVFVHKNPSGGGTYIKHHVIEQRLIQVFGRPPMFERVEIVFGDVAEIKPNPNGSSTRAKEGRSALKQVIVGVVCRMTVTIAGEKVVVEEVGDCEQPHNWDSDGQRLKDAFSDAYKRCAMRLGCGLHLYSQDEYFLHDEIRKVSQGSPDGAAEGSRAQVQTPTQRDDAAPADVSGEVTDAGAQPPTQADAVPVASPDQSQKSQEGAGGEASAPSGSLSETIAELCPDRKAKNIALRTAVRLATEYEGVKPPASFDQVLEMDDEPVLSRLVEELRKKFAGAAA